MSNRHRRVGRALVLAAGLVVACALILALSVHLYDSLIHKQWLDVTWSGLSVALLFAWVAAAAFSRSACVREEE